MTEACAVTTTTADRELHIGVSAGIALAFQVSDCLRK